MTLSDFRKAIKPIVRRIEQDEGVFAVDDFIIDKPHSTENDIICYQFDHKLGRNDKGINVISFLYHTDLGKSQSIELPVFYEIVSKPVKYKDPVTNMDKRRSEITKNELVRERLKILAHKNRIKFSTVLWDTWYSSNDNFEFVHKDLKKYFVGALKSNRLVALRKSEKLEGKFQSVSAISIEPLSRIEVWIKGLDFPVYLTKQIFTNKDKSTVELYLVSNHDKYSYEQQITIYQKRWKVEQYHKSTKQNAALAKSPTKYEVTQSNHIFCSIIGIKFLSKINNIIMKKIILRYNFEIGINGFIYIFINLHYFVLPLFFTLGSKTSYSQADCCVDLSKNCTKSLFYNSCDIGIKTSKTNDFKPQIYSTLLMADIDNDCQVEIVTVQIQKGIVIYDPAKDTIERIIDDFYYDFASEITPLVLVDVDKDGFMEIIMATADYNNIPSMYDRLVCFNFDGKIRWISNERFDSGDGNYNMGCPGVADFNQDGIPEVYVLNKIYNAQTGVLLASGFGGLGISDAKRGIHGVIDRKASISVAADLDSNPNDLELAAGYTVYQVNLTNSNGLIGNQMVANSIIVNGAYRDGATTLSDIDNDGSLDIIVSSELFGNRCWLYAYSFKTNVVQLLAQANPRYNSIFLSNALVADYDGDGSIEIFVNNYDYVLCYEYDGTTMLKLKMLKSNCSMINFIYDFNFDGKLELIFYEDNKLIFYNFSVDTLVKITETISDPKVYPPRSPLVFRNKNSDETSLFSLYQDLFGSFKTAIINSESNNEKWCPPRNIWHQYSYNPLFINDDGTVPQFMKNPATFENGRLNNMMVQDNILNKNDNSYKKPSAVLSGNIICINYNILSNDYSVNFSIHNGFGASLPVCDSLPISFYNGNPESGGSLIGVYRTSTDIIAGATISPLTYTFSAVDLTSLYMVVNTDKSPIILSDSLYYDIDECDYTDNVFIAPAPKIINTSQEICQGDSFDFYGNVLTVAGTYHHELLDNKACDSIVAILDLQVTNTKTAQQNIAICERYDWNGTTYTLSGQYTFKTTSTNGCDSIVTLDLTIHPKQNTTLIQSACDTYAWQGTTYDQSGQYAYNTQTINGCDSIITLDLTIHPSYDIRSTVAACDSFTWQGTTYGKSGIYTLSTMSAAGCDSIMTLDLTILKVLETSQTQAVCDNYTWNGNTYTQSGLYTFKTTSTNGCDSIVTLDLTIHPRQNTTLIQSACDTYAWQGTTYDQSGQYEYNTQTINGCDSIITLDLTIHPIYDIRSTVAACDSFTWQGTTYGKSGIYTVLSKTVAGCDSLLTLALTISHKSSSIEEHEACTVYVWNGQEYRSSGTYSYLTKNKAGCDSLATLALDIYPSFHRGDTIITEQDYTWPIDGQTYTQSGQYIASFSTEAGCDSIYTLLLRIAKETNLWFPTIFNPSGTQNNVFYGSSNRDGLILSQFRVYDRWSNLVYDKSPARVNEASDGWYGRFQNQYCVPGVYVWVAQILHEDGSIETRYGDVTLIR